MSLTSALAKNLDGECPTCYNPFKKDEPTILDLHCDKVIHLKCVASFFKKTAQTLCTNCNQEGDFVVHEYKPNFSFGTPPHLERVQFEKISDSSVAIKFTNDTQLEQAKYDGKKWHILYFDKWTHQYKHFHGSKYRYLFERGVEGFIVGATLSLPFSILVGTVVTGFSEPDLSHLVQNAALSILFGAANMAASIYKHMPLERHL